MAKAIWNNTMIAESSETIVVEGNHYFPGNIKNYVAFWRGVKMEP